MLKRGILVFLVVVSLCYGVYALSGDFNSDCKVDFQDYVLFAQGYSKFMEDRTYDGRFDLDGDGQILFSDFAIFARGFGGSCGESPVMTRPIGLAGISENDEQLYNEATNNLDESRCDGISDLGFQDYCRNSVAAFISGRLPESASVYKNGFTAYHVDFDPKTDERRRFDQLVTKAGSYEFTNSEYKTFTTANYYIKSDEGEGLVFWKSLHRRDRITINFFLWFDHDQELEVYEWVGNKWKRKTSDVQRFSVEKNKLEKENPRIKKKGRYSFTIHYRDPFAIVIVGKEGKPFSLNMGTGLYRSFSHKK
ncbi:MAG: hypothetical protein CMH63_02035 [Nanoarchaeota archaeon]|jgi:hypothetical protein|nr:hypothetical protein [Nanoarchaeota archaeon]|tara:strand:- start:8691 stop:9614 length:924 start_codon:yes stop_codon:yes gene_type:complete